MEFDPFGLSVKDLITRNVIAWSNSTARCTRFASRVPLLPASPRRAPCLPLLRLVFWPLSPRLRGTVVLATLALTPYLACLGHRSSFISCTSTNDFCHAYQLGKHTRLPFSSSSSRAEKAFDLLHLDLWTSPVVSVSGSKYYLVILDDFTHYLCTFSLKQKSDTFTTLSSFFAYVAT
jgi:hypothetical protein